MAPPTKYPENAPALLRELAAGHKDGLTDDEVGDYFGVSYRTVQRWGKKYPEFLQALIDARAVVDSEVERSLYRRAIGYKVTERKTIKDAVGVAIRTETTTKEILPDVTAQIFWLKNRRPKDWRDVRKMEHSGEDGGPIVIVDDISRKKEEGDE